MLSVQRHHFIAVAVFLVLVSFTFFFFRQDEPVAYTKASKVPYRCGLPTHLNTKPTMREAILSLFESIKHDPANPEYRSAAGQKYVANETTWTKPLGKNVLIVDIDTRVPTGDNQVLNPEKIDFENLEMKGGGLVSNAIINHYLYALIHGYDYKFYQAQHIPDHHDTWIMPHVFRELILDYQFVVAMDADVTLPHLDVPLEWMFNRWGIKEHTSMALPWDTMEWRNNKTVTVDSQGLRVLNTGFVVAQNSEVTIDLLEKWRDCTTEKRYLGCAKWKETWSHEQRAFSEYIRYDYNFTPETIISIPCDDAVGWPGFKKDLEGDNYKVTDCSGNFVRHYTIGKDKVKTAGTNSIMQALSDVLQRNLLKNSDTMWYKEKEKEKEPPKEEEETEEEEANEEEEEQAENELNDIEEAAQQEAVPLILEGMILETTSD
jgi:hypothetical protein